MLRRSSGGAAGRTESGSSAPGTGDVGKRSTSRRWHFGFTAGFRPRAPAAAVLGVGKGDLIAGAAEAPQEGILGPGGGEAGIQLEARTGALEAEDALRARGVHPPRGAGVPRPTAAPGVGRVSVD